MRTPKFDWEAHKDQLLELRYTQGKSLNEISKIVYEKTGIAYTAARVSQVFKGWKEDGNREKTKVSNAMVVSEQRETDGTESSLEGD